MRGLAVYDKEETHRELSAEITRSLRARVAVGLSLAAETMRLCVLNEFFYPEASTGTGRVVSSIARTLEDQYGVDVSAVASQNPYQTGGVRLAAHENWDGIDIHRPPSPNFNRRPTPLRFFGNLVFARRALRLASRLNPEVVLVTTAPPVLPSAALALRRKRGIPYVYIVYDLEPNRTLALGVVRKGALAAERLAKAQGEWMKGAFRVVAIGRCMAEIIATDYGVAKDRIAVIPVGSPAFDTKNDGVAFRKRNDLEGFLAVYSGNFARYHEFDTILRAAAMLQERNSSVQFVLIGSGYQKDYIESEVTRLGLGNVKLKPFVPDSEYGGMLNGSDVCLVSLKPSTVGTCVPSKFYTQLAAGRPTVAIMPENGEVARVVRESESGIVIAPGDFEGLATALEKLKGEPDSLNLMGKRAEREFREKYTEAIVVQQIHRCLADAVAESNGRDV